jgi:hypothetical protein
MHPPLLTHLGTNGRQSTPFNLSTLGSEGFFFYHVIEILDVIE